MTQPPSEPAATEPEPQPESSAGGYPPPGQYGTAPPEPSVGFPSSPPQQGGYSQQGGYGPPQQAPTQGDGAAGQPAYGQGFPPPTPQSYPPPAPGGGYGQPGQYPPPGSPPPAQGGYGPPQGYPPPAQGGYGAPQGFPPPAPGGYGPPPGFPPPATRGGAGPGLPNIDVSKVGTGDWVVIGLGGLLLIFSFFGWWSVSYNFIGVSQSESVGAWHRFWWIAPLLILAVTLVRAAQLLTGLLTKEVKPLWLLYAAVAAVVFYLISLIDLFTYSSGLGLDDLGDLGGSISAGPGFGIWASLILSLAFVYFLALSLQARGEKLPVAVPGPKL